MGSYQEHSLIEYIIIVTETYSFNISFIISQNAISNMMAYFCNILNTIEIEETTA